jgi:hypothetical protein
MWYGNIFFPLDLSLVPKKFLTRAAEAAIGKVPEKQERLSLTDWPSCTQDMLITLRLEANFDLVLKCQVAGLIFKKFVCSLGIQRN